MEKLSELITDRISNEDLVRLCDIPFEIDPKSYVNIGLGIINKQTDWISLLREDDFSEEEAKHLSCLLNDSIYIPYAIGWAYFSSNLGSTYLDYANTLRMFFDLKIRGINGAPEKAREYLNAIGKKVSEEVLRFINPNLKKNEVLWDRWDSAWNKLLSFPKNEERYRRVRELYKKWGRAHDEFYGSRTHKGAKYKPKNIDNESYEEIRFKSIHNMGNAHNQDIGPRLRNAEAYDEKGNPKYGDNDIFDFRY